MNSDPGSNNERDGQNQNTDWLANTENGGAPIPEFKGKAVQAGEATPPAVNMDGVNMDPAAQVDWAEQPAEMPKPYEPPMPKLSESVKVAEPIKTEEADYFEKEKTPETDLNSDNNVYREIAKNALMNWNGLSEQEAAEKTAEGSVEELEGQVYAKGSIVAAVDGIDQALEHFGKDGLGNDLKDSLIEGIFNGKKDEACFRQLKEKLAALETTKERFGVPPEAFTLKVLETIHNKWIEDNKAKFFDPKRADKRYQFMPLELIGSEEAKADLLFLEPVLNAADMEVNEDTLDLYYGMQQKLTLGKNDVIDMLASEDEIGRDGAWELRDSLANDIFENTEKYYKDEDEIFREIKNKNSPMNTYDIARQVEQHNQKHSVFAEYKEIKDKIEAQDIEKAKSVRELILPEKRDEWNEYVGKSREMVYGTGLIAHDADLIKALDGKDDNPDYEGAQWLFNDVDYGYRTLMDLLRFSTNGPNFVEKVIEKDDWIKRNPENLQKWQELIKKHKEENARLLEKHKENNN